ncbi:hypothetical protein QYF36_020546 [Acer negundo]|nr:hypothetical protein QYF36_020546 [Acer negundo]
MPRNRGKLVDGNVWLLECRIREAIKCVKGNKNTRSKFESQSQSLCVERDQRDQEFQKRVKVQRATARARRLAKFAFASRFIVKEMEENTSSSFLDGQIVGIRFGLATHKEICAASISDCSISHASQLANPFLGLPLEFGKCESCGVSEAGQCEGHFGYIQLPTPIYHPSHINELKRMLSLLCLKCLKLKSNKLQMKSNGIAQRLLSSCCEDAAQVSVRDVKTSDGACYLKLKLPSKFRLPDGFWNFLERYGFHYGDDLSRTLLPLEVKEMLKRIPADTRKKLAKKGYFPQDGYIMEYLPVPPNCLSVPDVSDGVSTMSSDLSLSMLKKVLKKVEIIKNSRSGTANFESQEVESNDLQIAVDEYLQVRGTARASRDIDARYGVTKESSNSSTKAWLEKMRTLFIRKGSGFSSRSVITGDAYRKVNEIGVPFEVAQRITFEERVNVHNMKYLQDLVDNKLCLTYGDGSSTYSLREGSKGHTFLRPGQVVHRRIMDGDTVFINRPPTTHKHSLQALSVYVHDDHTVKINPLICGPLSADFDGDCIHLFYPQSLPAKAEVMELFSVEKQLLSSHSGNLNLQLATDSLLSLKVLFKRYILNKVEAQQLSMFVLSPLPQPALLKSHRSGPYWTALQMLQTVLPASFDCCGDRYLISKSDILNVDFNRDIIQPLINDVVASIFFEKGPEEVLKFFNSLQPLLMENLFAEGFSVGLEDFSMSKAALLNISKDIHDISPLLHHLRSTQNELVELQLEHYIRHVKVPVANFILKASVLGNLIDSKSESAVSKVVQQTGFLGLQLSDKGKFYSKTLVEDIASHFQSKYPLDIDYPSAKYGLIKGCFFHGLDPYEEMVHSVSTREVMVRSSRGLSEPGTLFKNLMAILRDVVICYDGTVRNVCSNSIIQFEYAVNAGSESESLFPAGEPVGVLAATAMSNPAYKAVLDSSPSSNNSWELMKEILLCRVSFKNDLIDRRVILYLNDCYCPRKYCRERAAYMVKNLLKRVSLKDTAFKFLIEYMRHRTVSETSDGDAGLVAHVHLNKTLLTELDISMQGILQKCQDTIKTFSKKKKAGHLFKSINLFVSECCNFEQSSEDECSSTSCLMFQLQVRDDDIKSESHILANLIYPVLSETIIKGDPRIQSANIIWISPDTTTWIRNPSMNRKGELALDVVLEKSVVKQSGDAWRIVLDSCLPVLHLIDTKRSIPYAIKQVQELLGVSCAFEQAVQRLSASVTMVAKGLRKEHLILLANSMTCAGNLVGFNSGGYKALSRALNVQVPFTEATLFTPRKCFEKAAEKCHTDMLSSIVASCSWGKHVAVGTGSRFDILWDTEQAQLNQEHGIDVYNFLHMVRSSTGVEETNTGCLGAEVEDLESEDEIADWNLSPEQNSGFDKPTFEDGEFQNCLDNQPEDTNWEKVSLPNGGSSGGGNWDLAKSNGTETDVSEADPWGSWNKDKDEVTDVASIIPCEEVPKSSSWDSVASGGKKADDTTGEKSWSDWGKQEVLSTEPCKDPSKSSDWNDATASWGKKAEDTARAKPWSDKGKQELISTEAFKDSSNSSGWKDAAASWGKKAEDTNWGKQEVLSTEACKDSSKSSDWKDAAASWGEKNVNSNVSWGKNTIDDKSEWTKNDEQPTLEKAREPSLWDNKGTRGKESQSQSGWDTGAAWETKAKDRFKDARSPVAKSPSVWGAEEAISTKVQEDSPKQSAWGQPNPPETSGGWPSSNEPKEPIPSGRDLPDNSSWGQQKSPDVSHGWGAPNVNSGNEASSQGWSSANESSQPASSNGWGAPNANSGNEGENNQWGQSKEQFKKKRFEGSRGWGSNSGDWNDSSNSGEWKGRKLNRPPRSPGVFNDNPIVNNMFTVTRQRLDLFTSEEQDILSALEPIMKSIRRIMHQSGYNDEDPISADDQSFIIDNVFNYHPDKAVKMGAGIDHIMINKHSTFLDTRCLWVVSTDGLRQDFSYRKCLDNFVREKYPDLAEEFLSKYFKPRTGGKREQTPVLPPVAEEEKREENEEEKREETTQEEKGEETTQE